MPYIERFPLAAALIMFSLTGRAQLIVDGMQYGNAVGMNDPNLGNAAALVFPNPASSILNIRATGHRGPFEVFNALGERVLVSSAPHGIDVSTWTEGFYFIRSDSGNGTSTQRFTVQH